VLLLCRFAVLPFLIFDFRLPIYDLKIANCKLPERRTLQHRNTKNVP
jgi:hypothetical protein